ncbi:MAG TPA: type II 3-dehydroquinate dehydratase [Ornithinimicrobium sp.]|uniref:type II 3-dehydroquinate dehydratase n=1 Tax=Ornithinimicrobium sp. TaxID=1977084 RepID=UPI002B475589|nr:type II 3-dehydroquinate dehydratase [Ornithinimicrobium sp.]HKJ11896.1 type II 3-dehydroquinate dehydratase [Ornithinimicrobium sp.]
MSRSVLVISGPNLAALGSRQPEVYGTQTLAEVHDQVVTEGAALGLDCQCRQSDDEAQIVAWLHEAAAAGSDIVLNPAAFTHYSYAVADACAHARSRGSRLIEVHLSNPAAREGFRQVSVVAPVASGTVAGFGARSYLLALQALAGPESTGRQRAQAR